MSRDVFIDFQRSKLDTMPMPTFTRPSPSGKTQP